MVLVLRPISRQDLPSLIAFSKSAGFGITSLPQNVHILEKKLERSLHSFQSEKREHKTFLFCLELDRKVIGISGIVSRIATDEPFFALHHLLEPLHSKTLKIEKEISVLHFIRARKKPTEIGTLFLLKEFRHSHFGKLLSLSRFLFIAAFRDFFANTVIAELRGINVEGVSPFWDAVGSHFFNITFPEADLLRAEHPECIEELFPKHPLYSFLLPKEAQEVLGKPHPETLPAQHFLEKQGFRLSHYLDIFDAGPHVFAPTDEIDAVRSSRLGVVKELKETSEGSQIAIVSNERMGFRACQAHIVVEEGAVILDREALQALEVDIGDAIRYYIL